MGEKQEERKALEDDVQMIDASGSLAPPKTVSTLSEVDVKI
jgi:hypothetical protein